MGYAIEEWTESTFSAGQIVPAGHYMRIDKVNSRVLELTSEDVLPASLDGTIAAYVRLEDVGWRYVQWNPPNVVMAS